MIYIVIPDNSKKDFIRSRVDSLNWKFFIGDSFFLVHSDLEDAKYVLDALCGNDKLANTFVFKLDDATDYFYWGYASEDMWNWFNENSESPHKSWSVR